ncbi:TNNC2 [Symbiodinium sp. CCMP2456]|nr:TNNC2 [Symbiodinium sp. CCMP2456]
MPRGRRKACKAVKKKFHALDRSGDGKLDFEELSVLLRSGDRHLKDAEIRRLFGKIDQNNDGRIDFAEFCDYIFELEDDAKRAPPEVEATFDVFSGFNDMMTMSEFAKLCKDCCLHNAAFKPTDAAILFSKVKPRGKRELGMEQFLEALDCVAEKRGCEVSEVHKAITIAFQEASTSGGWASVSVKELEARSRARKPSEARWEERDEGPPVKASPSRLSADERREGLLLDLFLEHSVGRHGGMEYDILLTFLQDAGFLRRGIAEHHVKQWWEDLVHKVEHRGRVGGRSV